MIGIYKITNSVNSKCYIGQSVDINDRFDNHRTGKQSNVPLQRAIKKYGIENFAFEIIEICLKENLNEREIYWIEKYDSRNPEHGYNIAKGGLGIGSYWQQKSDEERKEISKKMSKSAKNARLKQWQDPSYIEKRKKSLENYVWWRRKDFREESYNAICPGEDWERGRLPQNEEIVLNNKKAQQGLRHWHNPSTGDQTRAKICPGEGWIIGRGNQTDEQKKNSGDSAIGKTWWTNGYQNVKSKICPENYFAGRVTETTKRIMRNFYISYLRFCYRLPV